MSSASEPWATVTASRRKKVDQKLRIQLAPQFEIHWANLVNEKVTRAMMSYVEHHPKLTTETQSSYEERFNGVAQAYRTRILAERGATFESYIQKWRLEHPPKPVEATSTSTAAGSIADANPYDMLPVPDV